MRSVVHGAVEVGEALLDLVVPRTCAGCGAARYLLCPACVPALAGPAFPTRPIPAPPGLPAVWAVAAYEGVPRQVLLAHKEHGRLGLAAPIGRALACAVAASVVDTRAPVALVPVPSSPAATRRRGHDPLLRCSRAAAYALRLQGRPVLVAPVLRLARQVADQAGLDSAGRAANLAGAHQVRTRRAARLDSDVLLVVVDDLVTTGASLAEAARALRDFGRDPVAAAVVAATRRRSRLDRLAGNA